MIYNQSQWVLFHEGCSVCSLAMGGHHHQLWEDGCICAESTDTHGEKFRKIVLPFRGTKEQVSIQLASYLPKNAMSWAAEHYKLEDVPDWSKENALRQLSWIKTARADHTPWDYDRHVDIPITEWHEDHGSSGYYTEILCPIGGEYIDLDHAQVVNSYAPPLALKEARKLINRDYEINQDHWIKSGIRGIR